MTSLVVTWVHRIKKISPTVGGHVVLPGDILPYIFTTLIWDNTDILEETPTGGGTSHRLNGIIVQSTMPGPRSKRKRRGDIY